MDWERIIKMGKAELNRELKCQKFCAKPKGGDWLRTRVRWLRKGDIVRKYKDGEPQPKPTYKITSDPFWSAKHECWDVKMIMWERV